MFESMLRAMKPSQNASGAKQIVGTTESFWKLMQAVSAKKSREDFLTKDHCDAAATIAPLEKSEKLSVDELGKLLVHFIPTFLSKEPDCLDRPCELDRHAPV